MKNSLINVQSTTKLHFLSSNPSPVTHTAVLSSRLRQLQQQLHKTQPRQKLRLYYIFKF